MITIEKTIITGVYNLVDDSIEADDKYLKQLTSKDVRQLAMSIIDLIQ